MKIVAVFVAFLVFCLVAVTMQDTKYEVRCADVSGGYMLSARGVDFAEKVGDAIHWLTTDADKVVIRANYEDLKARIKRYVIHSLWETVLGVGKGGKAAESGITIQRKARKAQLDGEKQCTPCPTAANPNPDDPIDPPGGGGGYPPGEDPRARITNAAVFKQDYVWSAEQVSIAKTVVAVGKRMNIPQQGWVVAIAAGFQESGMRNLDYGDRDSQGFLQQRPSAGWGTVAQIRDPAYAVRSFYRHLVRVPGWSSMTVNDAAQRVQISATPYAYGKWETEARSLVNKIGGTPAVGGAPDSDSDLPEACVNTDGSMSNEWGDTDDGSTATVTAPTPATFDQQGNPHSVDQTFAWLTARQDKVWYYQGQPGVRKCLAMVAEAYGWVDGSGSYSAASLWSSIPAAYKGTGAPPRGALVFWRTSVAEGHVAIADGAGGAWTTDGFGATGEINHVSLKTLDGWGPRLGWSVPRFVARVRAA